jgi:DNA ligase-1
LVLLPFASSFCDFVLFSAADGSEPDHSAMEESIQSFMNEAVQSSCEGLMVKSLEVNSGYIPNKRNWVKLKKDYLAGVGDTLDLVVIGAWQGKGKRTGVYGAFLLATYDPESEEYQSICKVGTGLSDAFLESSAQYFSQHILDNPPREYKFVESDMPDVWFKATRIWEIKCADLSLSPHHKAAIGRVHESKGIALRFPRFVRERVGTDEKVVPDGITDAEQVTEMFHAQAVQGGNGGNGNGGGGAQAKQGRR